MENLDQLQKEWVIINAFKELLTIFKKRPNVTYKDAIEFAKENAAEIFENSKTGLSRKTPLEKLRDKYEQEATAKSIETGDNISPTKLIENRLHELDNLISVYPEADDPDGLRKEREVLKKLSIISSETILNLERITENQAIINDAFAPRTNKIFINSHLGKYNEYRDKESENVLRINILYPNLTEAITGADLIYEQYNAKKNKVRIAAIQYKVWEKGVLYISQAGNILKQIDKMEKCFCWNEFCKESENMTPMERYRLPFCSAFLRPTDKLQNPNKLISSGYHVPICCIKQLMQDGKIDYKIDLDLIKQASLKSQSFEELFNAEMIGSRWLNIRQLEGFYKETKILEPSQKIVLYAQNMES